MNVTNKSLQIKPQSTLIKRAVLGLYPMQVIYILLIGLGTTIDTYFIGNFYGKEGLSAISLASPLLIVLWVYINLINVGAKVLTGKYLGKKRINDVNRVFTLSLILIILGTCIFLPILCYMFNYQIALFLGSDQFVIDELSHYIKGVAFIFPSLAIMNWALVYLVFKYKPFVIIFGSVVTLVINGYLDYIFLINGLSFFYIALATAISYLASVIIYCAFLFTGKFRFKFNFSCFKKSLLISIFKTGVGACVVDLLLALRTFSINQIVLNFLTMDVITALAVEGSIASIIGCTASACGAMVLTIATVYIGKKDEDTIRIIIKSIFAICVVFVIIICSIFFIFAYDIALWFYNNDTYVVEYAALLIRGLTICLPINAVACMIINFYISLDLYKTVLRLQLLDYLVFPVLVCLVFTPIFGVWGVALSLILPDVFIIIIATIIVKKRYKDNFSIYKVFLFGKNIGDNKIDKVSYTISKKEQIDQYFNTKNEELLSRLIDKNKIKQINTVITYLYDNLSSNMYLTKKRLLDIRIAIIDKSCYIKVRGYNKRPDKNILFINNKKNLKYFQIDGINIEMIDFIYIFKICEATLKIE